MKKLILFFVLISTSCFSVDFGNIPPIIIKKIVDSAIEEHPDDYMMQNDVIELNARVYKRAIEGIAKNYRETARIE